MWLKNWYWGWGEPPQQLSIHPGKWLAFEWTKHVYYFLKSILKNPTASLLFRAEERFCLITYCVLKSKVDSGTMTHSGGYWISTTPTPWYNWGSGKFEDATQFPNAKGKIARGQGTRRGRQLRDLQRYEEYCWWSKIRNLRSRPSFWREEDFRTQILFSTPFTSDNSEITNDRVQKSRMIPDLFFNEIIQKKRKA